MSELLALLLYVLVFGDPEVNAESAANEYDTCYYVSDPLVVSVPPLLECGRDLSGSCTNVTVGVVVVVVLVAVVSGFGLTNVTIVVAIVIVSVGNASGFLTGVTLGIAVVVVLVSGLSGSLALVTLLITSVIVLVGRGSGSAADVTLGVAIVVELVLLARSDFGGLIAAFGLGSLLSENGYCGHSEQYAKNCKKSRKKGKILLHR